MAKRNNFVLVLGIIMVLIGVFLLLDLKTYSISCDVRVSNPVLGTADIDSASCEKTTKLFCGSPLSIATSDYNLKIIAGSAFKQEYFTLVGAPGFNAKSVDITVCSKEDVSSITLELFNKEDLKDSQEVSVS